MCIPGLIGRYRAAGVERITVCLEKSFFERTLSGACRTSRSASCSSATAPRPQVSPGCRSPADRSQRSIPRPERGMLTGQVSPSNWPSTPKFQGPVPPTARFPARKSSKPTESLQRCWSCRISGNVLHPAYI